MHMLASSRPSQGPGAAFSSPPPPPPNQQSFSSIDNIQFPPTPSSPVSQGSPFSFGATTTTTTDCTSAIRPDFSGLPPTPPDEDARISWDPATIQSPALFKRQQGQMNQTYTQHQPQKHLTQRTQNGLSMVDSSHADSSSSSGRSSNDSLSSSPNGSNPVVPSNGHMAFQDGVDQWLQRCLGTAVSCLPLSSNSRCGGAVKMVSQMLPYPRSPEKTVKLPTENNIFFSLVKSIQNSTPGKLPYINVTHAVPEHFNLSNLPASPSSTPRPADFSADDYFASTVFSSAAVVSAYHDFRGRINRWSPHSPSPIVPPQTVQAAVLERYIPPASLDEHRDFFRADGPSHLVDRLCELSPDGSSLLLVYPTRKGVNTFQERYIAPVLDPLIRQLVVVNGMSSDLGQFLGRYSFAMEMEDFSGLQEKLQGLCHSLSGPESRFDLVDAETGQINLDRNLWGEWYVYQERKRFKEVLHLNPNHSEGSRSPEFENVHRLFGTQPGMTSSVMLTEILEGLRKRPYCTTYRPPVPMEMGVFVLRRSPA